MYSWGRMQQLVGYVASYAKYAFVGQLHFTNRHNRSCKGIEGPQGLETFMEECAWYRLVMNTGIVTAVCTSARRK